MSCTAVIQLGGIYMDILRAAVPALIFAACSAANAQDVLIINGSTSDIKGIYLTQTGADDWEENLIDGYVLPAGYQVTIELEKGFGDFDLNVESTQGGEESYEAFPAGTTRIVLHGDGNTDYFED